MKRENLSSISLSGMPKVKEMKHGYSRALKAEEIVLQLSSVSMAFAASAQTLALLSAPVMSH